MASTVTEPFLPPSPTILRTKVVNKSIQRSAYYRKCIKIWKGPHRHPIHMTVMPNIQRVEGKRLAVPWTLILHIWVTHALTVWKEPLCYLQMSTLEDKRRESYYNYYHFRRLSCSEPFTLMSLPQLPNFSLSVFCPLFEVAAILFAVNNIKLICGINEIAPQFTNNLRITP